MVLSWIIDIATFLIFCTSLLEAYKETKYDTRYNEHISDISDVKKKDSESVKDIDNDANNETIKEIKAVNNNPNFELINGKEIKKDGSVIIEFDIKYK